MKIKKISIQEIIEFLGDNILNLYGNTKGVFVDNIADAERVNETTLDWINPSKDNKQQIAEASIAKAMLVDPSIEFTPVMKEKGKVLLIVDNPKYALIAVINHFFVTKKQHNIDPSSVIHPNAKIGMNVYIGANCYIGDCIIGNNNVIHANVCIYDRTIIGNNNVIHSGALICVDGLGCIRNTDGTLTEFPQLGGVIIGDNTYIGGNTHIASGSLSDTIIESGCKINGMCFIGSNNHLGENVWITGSTMLAGSVKVGKNSTIFSKVVVREWCNIGENVTIGMGSVVTKNIPAGETWLGNPARKFEKK
jgi:UDP-3-O-[3-hydroxymyristoyl] glucosamine N-acyltransferase